jgi:hypothetical protein
MYKKTVVSARHDWAPHQAEKRQGKRARSLLQRSSGIGAQCGPMMPRLKVLPSAPGIMRQKQQTHDGSLRLEGLKESCRQRLRVCHKKTAE